MDNRATEVSGPEALSRPRSRAEFFRVLAAAGVGAGAAVAGSAGLAREVSAQGAASDIELLNFALTVEYFESEVLYPAALEAGILSGEALAVVTQLRDIEIAHRDALIALIQQLGGTPIDMPQYTLPPGILASQQAFLEYAAEQERIDVGATLGLAPMIQSPQVLAGAAAIEVVEGENLAAVKDLLGVVPPANVPFPEALTRDQVLAALAPILGMGAMPDTGGVAPSGR